jgi:hypothetical protein
MPLLVADHLLFVRRSNPAFFPSREKTRGFPSPPFDGFGFYSLVANILRVIFLIFSDGKTIEDREPRDQK